MFISLFLCSTCLSLSLPPSLVPSLPPSFPLPAPFLCRSLLSLSPSPSFLHLLHSPPPLSFSSARLSLASGVKEVRAGALRVLRYVLTSKDIFSVMLKHRVDLLVARSLDVSSAREIERIQAMRFVRQVSLRGHASGRSVIIIFDTYIAFDT